MTPAVIRQSILDCQRCELHLRCKRPVPFTGPTPALIALVGEAPGKTEDEEGKPFIGPAGKLLWEELQKVGIERADVFVCNAVCCYPHGTPSPDAIEACKPHLQNQLRIAKPAFVLIVGGTALSVFGRTGITQAQGRYWKKYVAGKEVVYFPLMHPAAILRNRLMTKVWRDTIKLFGELVEARR